MFVAEIPPTLADACSASHYGSVQPEGSPVTTFSGWFPIKNQNSRFKAGYNRPVLLELRVENYAVINNVVVEFAPGLNLLSGETGAGKSILIDALALLLGERASHE